MKNRGMELHLLLLAVALMGAWYSWFAQSSESTPSGNVPVWDLGSDPIKRLSYASEALQVTLETRKGEAGASPYFWAQSTRTTNPAKTTDPAADQETVEKSFRVSHSGEAKVREAFRTLTAERTLGSLDATKRAEFELAPPNAEIKVSAGGKSYVLEVGMQAHGANMRYVCAGENAPCYVMKGGVIDDLKWADSRLYERNLFRLEKPAVTTVSLSCENKKRRWTRPPRDAAKEQDRSWLEADPHPNAPHKQTQTPEKWLNQTFRLRVVNYLSEVSEPEILIRTEITDPASESVWIELARKGEAKETTYLARSPQSGGWVQVSTFLGKEMETDLSNLCGP